MNPVLKQIARAMDERRADLEALERTIRILQSNSNERPRIAASAERSGKTKKIVKDGGDAVSAVEVEHIIAACPQGITSAEIQAAFNQNSRHPKMQSIYNHVHYLKKRKRIKTDASGRHHARVQSAGQLTAGS